MSGISELQVHLEPKTVFTLFEVIPITDTILNMWLVMFILISLTLFIRLKLKYLPSGFQNLVEWSLGGLHDFMENIGGKEAQKHFVPFITFFLVILFSNWLGLSLGFISEHLNLRAPTSDLNSTAALAISAFLYFEYQGVKAHGFFAYLGHFINIKAVFKKGPMGIIDFFVGILHIVSELVRPIALSLRLFGNIFGGEIVLAVAFLLVKPLIPIPFMILEFVVGLIQAFVFATLFLTFTSLNTAHTIEQAH
ncbi:F0F1 ATP synthase subunit A [Candidatus Peregrinibacteria bacterium]|nr:F0F1 ATP synthase subunit A [Candidatus Peregrinibacteria bacterium]